MRLLRQTERRLHRLLRSTIQSPACKGLQDSVTYPGSATSFGGAFAPGYGSGLLPLRLTLLYSQAIRFSAPPEAGGFPRFATPRPLPVLVVPFRFPVASRDLLVRSAHQDVLNVPVPVSVMTLSVTGIALPVKTASNGAGMTRIATRFLIVVALRLTPQSLHEPLRHGPGEWVISASSSATPPERHPLARADGDFPWRGQVTGCP